MEIIHSKVFGEVKFLDDNEEEFGWLQDMINDYPVNTFGILNKKLNTLGFLITIGVIK